MPLPSAYTEASLAQYLASKPVMGAVADALGWEAGESDAGDYAEIVNDALTLYGVSDIEDAADIARLRVAARYAGWKAAVQATAGFFSFSTDGQTFTRAQLQQMALAAYQQAEKEARSAGLATAESPVPALPFSGTNGKTPIFTRSLFRVNGGAAASTRPLGDC